VQQFQDVERSLFPRGAVIEVRDHYCGNWCRGFEVAATSEAGVWVRRLSDHYVLPIPFSEDELRRGI
jgi:hypothetical protein